MEKNGKLKGKEIKGSSGELGKRKEAKRKLSDPWVFPYAPGYDLWP